MNFLLGTNLFRDDIDTIGEWFLTQNFNAETGTTEIEHEGYIFKVHKKDGHQIRYLEVNKAENLIR
ncbi:hypothetical protein J7E95_28040 [Streptomyces sp. ISL-14]|uniref:transporter associated domain-containing protein n=1 Tax=Bacillus sp. ISL-4 TaxID=2819125 RepID=UPI001C1CDD06|nr:transporter associated domain-containing protein [Bacillus sp. ISL-4]MBT2674591.1 hypothetical protein [Streptomyces sp. ISL-14]